MNQLFLKLQDWIKIIQKAIIGSIIFEAVLVIIIGVASNKISTEPNPWVGILIFCSILYIAITALQAAYQIKYPASIVDELHSKIELEKTGRLFDRQKLINELIKNAIQGLNTQTCSIDMESNDNLCDQQLEVRLQTLLSPILEYTDVILDSSTEKRFTIGVHLDSYQKIPAKGVEILSEPDEEGNQYIEHWDKISDQGILILKDELILRKLLPKELLNDTRVNGASYEIQTAIKRTLNNLKFDTHNFECEDQQYTIISSEILEVCSDDYVNGVLFVIFKKGINIPDDTADILSIFNRVTSNYVSKYNSCIIDQVSRKG